MKKITISEKELRNVIYGVLNENRKVIKVGGSQPAAPSMPTPDMGTDTGMQDPNMAATPDMGGMDGQMPNDVGGEMPMDNNQFDSNFDAGVEADEETDPKRYIQQLTGKLSQSLNSYNEENGPDEGISKYVASMIIAAAAKNLDEKAKKELIEKINSASSEEEIPDGEDKMSDGEMEDVPQDTKQQPMMESFITKKQLAELAFGTTKERDKIQPSPKPDKKNIFGGKSF